MTRLGLEPADDTVVNKKQHSPASQPRELFSNEQGCYSGATLLLTNVI